MIKREDERARMGQRIAEIRKQQGLTQQELAERAGIQRTHLVRIESGKYGISYDLLVAIATALGYKITFTKNTEL